MIPPTRPTNGVEIYWLIDLRLLTVDRQPLTQTKTNMDIEQHLIERGIKPTAMRTLVFRTLSQARSPQSLRDIEDTLITAERSTIFRALTLLVSHHLVHTIEDGSGALKYEVCMSHDHNSFDDHHPHFYCEHCGRTFCLHDERIPRINLPDSYQVHSINFVIKGICPDCTSKA